MVSFSFSTKQTGTTKQSFRFPVLILALSLIILCLIAGCGGSKKTSPKLSLKPGMILGSVTYSGVGSTSVDFITTSMIKQTTNNSQLFKASTANLSRNSAITERVTNEKIIKFAPGTSEADATIIITQLSGTIKHKLYGTDTTYLVSLPDAKAGFAKNAATTEYSADIEYIEDNLIVRALTLPNDPYFTAPNDWNYRMINLPAAWDIATDSPEIIVAVLDTGVCLNHPDLEDNLIKGWDCVDNDDDPSDTEYNHNPSEDVRYSHGTHVAGIIGATTNNSIGVAGVNWKIKIMPIRVLSSDGSGTHANLVEGINTAIENNVNIINLSLGSTDESNSVKTAIKDAIDKGITVIAATGNHNTNVYFPANYDPVIAVAAVNQGGTKASYSNFGSQVDLAAPGGTGDETLINAGYTEGYMVLSTSYDKKKQEPNYMLMSGTSQAAPHVSGLAALLYAQGINTPKAVEERLKATTYQYNNETYYGAGLINAFAALSDSVYQSTDLEVGYVKLPLTKDSTIYYTKPTNGNYFLPNLNAGKYLVYAWVDKDGSNNPSIGDLWCEAETSVSLGHVTTINLPLTTYTETTPETISTSLQSVMKQQSFSGGIR